MLKKINAYLSLVTTFLVVLHVIFSFLKMIGILVPDGLYSIVGRPLTIVFVFHALLSIYFVIYANVTSKEKNRDTKMLFYPNYNLGTILQRLSGFVLLAIAAVHIVTNVCSIGLPILLYIIGDTVFLIVLGVHLVESFSKALVTLGLVRKRETFSHTCIAVLLFSAAILVLYFVICAIVMS